MRAIIFTLVMLPLFLYAAEAVKAADPQPASVAVVAVMPDEAPPAIDLPPPWLENAINFARRIPFIGPVIVEVTKWAGVLGASFTLIVTLLLGLLRILVPVVNIAGLAALALKLQAFESSPIMYWLKFFSMYNAKKPEEKKAA